MPHPPSSIVAAAVEPNPRRTLPEHFLSVAIDVSQLVGREWWPPDRRRRLSLIGDHHPPPYDFNRPDLREWARALAPAYLKIGGTLADNLVFGPAAETGNRSADRVVLTEERWSELIAFCRETGLTLAWTLSVGRGRWIDGRYDVTNAEDLMRHAAAHQDEVPVWFLGNEVNAHLFRRWKPMSIDRYMKAYLQTKEALMRHFPKALLVAGSAAALPVFGEIPPFTAPLLRRHGSRLDAVSWHFYPQQSDRSIAAIRRARADTLLDPRRLRRDARFSRYQAEQRDRYAPHAPLWLGETASALCGGQQGVSDRFVSSLWWLIHLGTCAMNGHDVVVRQTLSGADYGLLDDDTLRPRPDYWASILWKRLMGPHVHTVQCNAPGNLHLFAHSQTSFGTLLAVNTDDRPITLALGDTDEQTDDLYCLTAPDLASSNIELNGQPLRALDAIIPDRSPSRHVVLPAKSATFVVRKFKEWQTGDVTNI